ncbi:glycoside hydrolase [Amylostereum chailletii]|nr:glycoside hydrolase [Amylostereum chailletii]
MRFITLSSFFIGLACNANPLVSRAPAGSKAVIVQMFEWTWDSIASECTTFLGPSGYGFVQSSPPQEHIAGAQWWTDYQPVSYNLTSKRGNRSQFQNMITTYTIFNHMAGVNSGIGVGNTSFTHYNYSGIYQYNNFHHCGLEPNDNIVNYNNAVEVQTCQLVNLADLATDTEFVRARLAQYANDLLSLGVDGFRLDASKRKFLRLSRQSSDTSRLMLIYATDIPVGDISNISSRFTSRPYITQEVIFGSGEPITPNQYTGNGDVQEFRYTSMLQNAFSSSGISSLQSLDNLGWVAGTQANVFVANHDTERNGNSLNANSPSNTYVLATIFSLAHPFGTPTILSSYTFNDTDAGAPNGGTGTCTTTGGSNGWLCQHRWVAISGMVGFRNNVGSTALTTWVSPSSQQIAFGRGAVGFVAINNQDKTWTTTFSTSLPNGVYCDVVHGAVLSRTCSGGSITVSKGSFAATIAARDAIAIHTGALGAIMTSSITTTTTSSKGTTSSTTTTKASSATTTSSSTTTKASSVTTSSSTTTKVSSTPSSTTTRLSSTTTSSSTTTTKSSTPATSSSSTTTTTRTTSVTSSSTPTPSSGTIAVSFAETATTSYGENIFVVGSIPQLGSWAPASAVALSANAYPVWKVTVNIPSGTSFQYKYIRKGSNGSVMWESDPDRNDTTPSSGAQTLNDSWR